MRLDARFIAAAALVCLIGLTRCGGRDPTPAEVGPLPQVDVSTLDPDLSERISERLALLLSDPESASYNGEAAKLLHAYGKLDLALQFYGRARTLEPSSIRWPYYLGVIQARQGHYNEAIASFNSALALDPTNLPARKRLARALLEHGSPDEGLTVYRALLDNQADDPEIQAGIGKAYAALGNATEATAHLTRAVELMPNYGEAHYALALAYRDLGDERRAGEALERYEVDKLGAPIGNDPLMAAVNGLKDNAAKYLRAGIESQKAGRIGEAIEHNLSALQVDPDLYEAHLNLIVLYGLVGEPDSAVLHYKKAHALNSNTVAVHYNYGRLLYDQGNYKQAESSFKRALEINPEDAFTNNVMGETSEQLGRLDDAIRYYRQAVANRPDYAHAHFNLGRTMMQKGRPQDAIGEIQRALGEETFRTPTYLATLASAYAQVGKMSEAADTFESARRMAQRYEQDEIVRAIERNVSRLPSP